MKLTVAYMRVSTNAQKDGNGLAQQRTAIVAYAAMHGVNIDDWCEDAETGTKDSRRELDRLKTMAEAGELGLLIVDRMDRLGRSLAVTENLHEFFTGHGVEIRCAQQSFEVGTPFGDFQRMLLGALAQYDRALLLSRMKACKRAALQNGRFIGGGVPFGYKLGREPGELKPNSDEAAVVREIFDLHSRGMSSVKIANALNARGVPTRQGAKWWNSTVLDVLNRADFYRGRATLHFTSTTKAAPVHEAIL